MLLENRTLIITGGGSGIGRAIAQVAAREGARVVVSDISEKGGEETLRLIADSTPGAETAFVAADAGRPEDHERLVATAVERFGGLHVAVNNAGIGGEMKPLHELSIEGWRRVIDLDLNGVFYAMRAQIPAMLESGGGSIVNITSILGMVGFPGASDYVAAKHGVVGISRNAALEYAQQGIRVNAVGPGFIDTPILGDDDARAYLSGLAPMGRLGRPEEIAELVAWLGSDRSAFTTGAYYAADGGFLAQ